MLGTVQYKLEYIYTLLTAKLSIGIFPRSANQLVSVNAKYDSKLISLTSLHCIMEEGKEGQVRTEYGSLFSTRLPPPVNLLFMVTVTVMLRYSSFFSLSFTSSSLCYFNSVSASLRFFMYV